MVGKFPHIADCIYSLTYAYISVHWACAGLDPEVSMLKKSWYCPSCTLLIKDLKPAIARRMKEREELPRTQDRERCLRPDCIHQ